MIYLISKNVGNINGAALVALDIVDSLTTANNKIGVVSRNRKIPEWFGDDFNKAVWITMPFSPRKETFEDSRFKIFKYLLRNLKYKLEMRSLQKQFKKAPPDLLVFNALTYQEQKLYQNLKNKCKTIQIVHLSPQFLQEFDNELSMPDALDIFGSSDALIFVSDECRKEWKSYQELKDRTSFYIPNCANEFKAKKLLESNKDDVRKDLELESDKFYLISVASFQPRKGQDLLVKAAPQLKKIAPNLEILFIGHGRNSYFEKLKEECVLKDLNFVKFLGRKSNAMSYIFASDAFILTSRAEAFPLVILEAMILKTPVLASNVNGVPEMIEDRENGYLFESDNIQELISAFETMYKNKEQRKNFVDRSSNKYWENFSKKHFMKRYKNIINKMIE